MRLRHLLVAAGLAALPLASASAQVSFERAGFRLTSIGERITVTGRVVDANRRPVAVANIRWRVADPSIATVTPQGVLTSRKVGNTKLWAVAGQDSASALILVDQWAAKFDFIPSAVRLDAVGASQALRIIVRDAEGNPIAGQSRKPASCRSLNERVAALSQTGELTARGIGTTYVRCADRGIADSVRIEVRQRPVRVTIADKGSLAVRVQGDTVRLRVNAADARGEDIRNVPATWASLNPTIVNVDPISGLARLVGLGTARIVAQAGDVTDTVSVGVAPALNQPVPSNVEATADASASARVPTIRIEALYPIVGDTVPLRYVVRDASGIEIPNASVSFHGDTSMIAFLSRGRVSAKREGNSYIYARFGETVDSARIDARTRPTLTVTRSDTANVRAFVRPTFDVEGLNATYKARRDSIQQVLFDSSRVRGLRAPGFLVSASIAGGPAAHSFTDSTGNEQRTGFVYGGQADVKFFRYLKLTGEFRTGTLNSSEGTGTELGITEAGVTLAAQSASEAFAVGGSYTMRATREGPSATPLAVQQWRYPRVFVAVRPAFIGGFVRTNMSLNALLPGATYTGYLDAQGQPVNPEALSLGGEAGLDVLLPGGWRAGLVYNVESFKFPAIGTGEPRRDQFSTVRIRAGWQFAR